MGTPLPLQIEEGVADKVEFKAQAPLAFLVASLICRFLKNIHA